MRSAFLNPLLTRTFAFALTGSVALTGVPGFALAQAKKDKTEAAAPAVGPAAPGKSSSAEKTKKALGGSEELVAGPNVAAPTLAGQSEVTSGEAADKKRDEAIKTLQDIIARMKGARDPQKAEMMFQLSELYGEKARYNYLLEMDQFNKNMDRCVKSNATDPEKCEKEVKPDTRTSKGFLKQSWIVYEKVMKDFPDYPRKDEILLALGYSKYDSGDKVEGIRYLWDLTKQYPNSRFTSDAYLRIGDHFFESNNVFKAVKAYEKAVERNDPQTFGYALYKLAWCDYNLGEYEGASNKFKQVIAMPAEPGNRKQIGLRDESLRDLVLTFSQLDYLDEARTYYEQTVGPDKTQKYIDSLARLYDQQGKDDMAIKSFRMLLEMDPYNAKAPVYQAAIVQAYARMNDKKMVRQESRRLVDNYRPDSPWSQNNGTNKYALETAYDLTETTLRELVEQFHYQAQKLQDFKTYGLARDIYKEYLDRFPESDQSNRMRFFYAEILYLMKDYVAASKEYYTVVEQKPDGEYSRNAAYAAVLCYEQLVENNCENPRDALVLASKTGKLTADKKKDKLKKFEMKVEGLKKGQSYEKTDFTECEQGMLAANDRFVKLVGEKDENYLPVKFKSAFTYFKHNDFEEAAKRLNEIIQQYPTHPLAKKSAGVVLDSFVVREDYKNVNLYAKEFRKNDKLAQGEFAKDLDELIEDSAFQIVLLTYNDGNANKNQAKLDQAANEFSAFATEYPKSKNVEKALYNAMYVSYEAGNMDLALESSGRLRERFGLADVQARLAKATKDDKAFLEKAQEDAEWYTAGSYQKIADFTTSAKWYDAYYADYGPKGKVRKYTPPKSGLSVEKTAEAEAGKKANNRVADALFLSAVFNQSAGGTAAAIEKYNEYTLLFPNDPDVPGYQFSICETYFKQAKNDDAYKCFENFRKKYKDNHKPGHNIEALNYQYELSARVKNKQAVEDFRKMIATSLTSASKEDLTPVAKLHIARAIFVGIEPQFEEYKAIKFNSLRNIKGDLNRKAKLLKELEGKYTALLGVGVAEYGLAGLYRIGQLYESFSKALYDAPVPKELSEEEADMYKATLEEKALPLEDKAIQAYQLVLDKATELSVFNEWTVAAQDRSNALNRVTFPDLPNPGYSLEDGLKAEFARAAEASPNRAN
jgi:TolA-binding protein